MNASQQEDFLLRQVAAVGAALARILGLRRGGAAEEARAALGHAYGLLLGTRSDLLRTVDVATAAALVDAPDEAHRAAREFLAGVVPVVDPRAFTLDQRVVLADLEGVGPRRVG